MKVRVQVQKRERKSECKSESASAKARVRVRVRMNELINRCWNQNLLSFRCHCFHPAAQHHSRAEKDQVAALCHVAQTLPKASYNERNLINIASLRRTANLTIHAPGCSLERPPIGQGDSLNTPCASSSVACPCNTSYIWPR